MFGPGKLSPKHRAILKQRIHKKPVRAYHCGSIGWSDKKLSPIKQQLRASLREQQDGRCYYCRRKILSERRNAYEDIEHFLDKSKEYYRKWSFSPVNLLLSCRACNFVKSTRDLGDADVQASVSLTSEAGQFLWIHPYFDDYHENIDVKRGWVYEVRNDAPRPQQSSKMITDLKLDQVETMERRKQEISFTRSRLIKLADRCITTGRYELAQILLKKMADLEEVAWAE